MKMRLQKYLSQCGIASRRASEKLIEDGFVCVNRRLAHVGQSIDPSIDVISVEGRVVIPREKKIYIILNKPRGYISSCSRAQGPALVDLVKIEEKVFPVGRLDMNSEGLILLTNDGELANKLTHPRYECEKEYEVQVSAEALGDEELKQLEDGVVIEEGKTKPCKLKRTGKNSFRIIIKEGKKRQIRRMCQAIGKKVVRLKRIRIKDLKLESLETGKWRELSKEEIEGLR